MVAISTRTLPLTTMTLITSACATPAANGPTPAPRIGTAEMANARAAFRMKLFNEIIWFGCPAIKPSAPDKARTDSPPKRPLDRKLQAFPRQARRAPSPPLRISPGVAAATRIEALFQSELKRIITPDVAGILPRRRQPKPS